MTSSTDTAQSPTTRTRRSRPFARTAITAAALAAAAALFGAGYLTAPASDRDSDVAAMRQNAAAVMPFDLDATTHTFAKTGEGGVEEVVADDPDDRADIDLIRGHLRHEAQRFTDGDFSDSAKIHGTDMPGLKQLEAAGGRLEVSYSELPGGARITYASADQDVTDAIHDWFDAQNHDHAMPGMG